MAGRKKQSLFTVGVFLRISSLLMCPILAALGLFVLACIAQISGYSINLAAKAAWQDEELPAAAGTEVPDATSWMSWKRLNQATGIWLMVYALVAGYLFYACMSLANVISGMVLGAITIILCIACAAFTPAAQEASAIMAADVFRYGLSTLHKRDPEVTTYDLPRLYFHFFQENKKCCDYNLNHADNFGAQMKDKKHMVFKILKKNFKNIIASKPQTFPITCMQENKIKKKTDKNGNQQMDTNSLEAVARPYSEKHPDRFVKSCGKFLEEESQPMGLVKFFHVPAILIVFIQCAAGIIKLMEYYDNLPKKPTDTKPTARDNPKDTKGRNRKEDQSRNSAPASTRTCEETDRKPKDRKSRK